MDSRMNKPALSPAGDATPHTNPIRELAAADYPAVSGREGRGAESPASLLARSAGG